jgi:hypothetical protein
MDDNIDGLEERISRGATNVFHDPVQLKQQFLSASNTECRDDRHSAIFQGARQNRLKALNAMFAIFMQPIAISALEY